LLTNEQIEYLFNFCTSNGVKYYDVQLELVDHLANAVEVEMANDPKITFEKALEKVHRSFGYMGFELLVVAKQKMIKKQNRNFFWNIFKNQFRWPKMLLFLILTVSMFTIFSINIWFIKPAYTLVLVTGGLGIPIYEFYLKVFVAKTGYEFLGLNLSFLSRFWIYPLLLPGFFRLYTSNTLFNLMPDNILIPGMSIFLSLYIISIIALWQTLSSVKKNFYKDYSKAFSIIR